MKTSPPRQEPDPATLPVGRCERGVLVARSFLHRFSRVNQQAGLLVAAGIVGVAAAGLSIAFRSCLEWIHQLATGQSGSIMESMKALTPWQRLALLTGGGALAGLVLQWGMRWTGRETTTDYMEAVVLGDGKVPVRASLVKSLSALCSIASGASIGREGPLVQLAAMAASSLARLGRTSTVQRRLLVACGAAAGIASAYNAPLTGAMFVAEVVLGTLAFETLGPLLFSSVVATATMRHVFGEEAIYRVDAVSAGGIMALPTYLVIAIAAGLLAPLFLQMLRTGGRMFAATKLPVTLKMALGGLIVGLLAAWHPEVCGNGSRLLNSFLHQPPEMLVLLLFAVLKLTATTTTFSSGAVGGVFTPTLFFGAALGQLCHGVLAFALPDALPPVGAFAIAGMGAFLAATTHAPVTAVLIVFELTLDYPLVLPLMMTCVVAHGISAGINPASIYNDSLARKAARLQQLDLNGIEVGGITRRDHPSVQDDAPFSEVVRWFSRTTISELPVLTSNRELVGVISLHDVKNHLDNADLARLILAGDISNPGIPALRSNDTLTQAMEAFSTHEGSQLPVLSPAKERPEYVGMISKTDLIIALAEQHPAPRRPDH